MGTSVCEHMGVACMGVWVKHKAAASLRGSDEGIATYLQSARFLVYCVDRASVIVDRFIDADLHTNVIVCC